jgi:myo-inositol-1(or 4)-monophosphatase
MNLSQRAAHALGDEIDLFLAFLEMARGALGVVAGSLERSDAGSIVQDENAAAAGASRSADIAVERWVAQKCAQMEVTLLSEERGLLAAANASHFLILDPIDGTAMALRGLPLYGVAAAVGRLHHGRIFLRNLSFGIVASPMGEYYGIRGGGAYAGQSPLETSKVETVREAMVRLPQRHGLPLQTRAEDFIYLGSTALELCWLAQGAVDIYLETKPRKVFDFAAGILIAEEAGATVTTLAGEVVLPNRLDARSRSTLLVTANNSLARDLEKSR